MTKDEKLYLQAKDAYYNDSPIMSDGEFDKLEARIKFMLPDSPALKQTGAPAKRQKAKLPIPIFSLDKVKPDTVEKWLQAHKGPYHVSEKLDGHSLEIVYDKGKISVYTRGDGITGKDVSFLAKALNLPATKASITVRAECILPKASFEALLAKEFANARNALGAVLNRNPGKQHAGATSNAKVIAYEILHPQGT